MGFDSLIANMNIVQDICMSVDLANDLQLPQIVVVGAQSAGKTSVIENIVGKDFIPRGAGIVTRRPLVVQLVHVEDADEYGVFSHEPEKTYTSFGAMREEIERETRKLLGDRDDVSHVPIILKMYSSKFVTLTLVDLPGLTRVAARTQPADISRKIEKIVREYVCNPNAIILAVTAANQDLANSEALRLAKSVDPSGARTLGVLSKVDLVENVHEVARIVAGKVVPLELGYVPVVNRAQQNASQTMRDAQKDEEEFFASRKDVLDEKQAGTRHLVARLQEALHMHILAALPSLRREIARHKLAAQEELLELGDADDASGKKVLLLVSRVIKDFQDLLAGDCAEQSQTLVGGSRLCYLFHREYAQAVDDIDPLEGLSTEHIRSVLYNSTGFGQTIFPVQAAFDKLVKTSIARLRPVSLSLLTCVSQEVVAMLRTAIERPSTQRFPVLRARLEELVLAIAEKHLAAARHAVEEFVAWNTRYINMKHPDFSNPLLAEAPKHCDTLYDVFKRTFRPPRKARLTPNQKLSISDLPNTQEKQEMAVLRKFLLSYMEIIKKTAADQIPKIVVYKFVFAVSDEMQSTLFTELSSTDVRELLVETEETKTRRVYLKTRLGVLVSAEKILSTQIDKTL